MKLEFFLILIFFLNSCHTNNVERKWAEKVKIGDSYLVKNNIDMAIKYWIESLEFKKDLKTYEKIIASFIIKSDFNQAKKYTLDGLTYFKNNDNLLFNLGLVNFYLEEYEESLKAMDELIKKNKYYPNAHYIIGLIYEKKGDFAKAKKEFIEEVNINPGSRKAWQKIKEMKNEK
ncbi:MAG: tetratricopeptide repeat protein [Candidatus Ratteibacteria bacterium]